MYLRGLGVYYFRNGQPVSSYTVGDVMTFNVPGYTQVWLDQYQNGNLQFSGVMSLPMPPYTLLPRDVGTFTASVFTVGANGKKSNSIGTDTVQVLAAAQPNTQLPATGKPSGMCYAGSVPVAAYPDGSCPPGSTGSPAFQSLLAPAYANAQYAGGNFLQPATFPTGVATATQPAPGQLIVQPPSGPLDLYGAAPEDTGGLAPVEAGMSPAAMVVLAGAAMYVLFSPSRRRNR